MALFAGTRLGPYEILSPIGAGGMGEVCRARDSKFGRGIATAPMSENGAGIRMRRCRWFIFSRAESRRLRAREGAIAL
jgi:hypothetical protein